MEAGLFGRQRRWRMQIPPRHWPSSKAALQGFLSAWRPACCSGRTYRLSVWWPTSGCFCFDETGCQEPACHGRRQLAGFARPPSRQKPAIRRSLCRRTGQRSDKDITGRVPTSTS